MLDPADYDDVLVLVAHPWLDFHVPLPEWIRTGPGPRPYVRIVAAKRASTDEPVDLAEIPLEYHNSARSRDLQRRGLLPTPWGPPPPVTPRHRPPSGR